MIFKGTPNANRYEGSTATFNLAEFIFEDKYRLGHPKYYTRVILIYKSSTGFGQ